MRVSGCITHIYLSYQNITGCLIFALLVHYFINIFPVTGCTFFTAVRNTWKHFNVTFLCGEWGLDKSLIG